MDVILRQDVKALGRAGEIIQVSDGYARNFLMPRELAWPATPANRRRLEAERQTLLARAATILAEMQTLRTRVAEHPVTIPARAGEDGKLFGAVTNQDIARALQAAGLSCDRRSIELPTPLKHLGDYQVILRLHPEVEASLQVHIVKA